MGYNTLRSETPIIPLVLGEDLKAFEFTRRLYEEGIFATPVVGPAVPAGQALIRTSYMSTHTDEDLDRVLEVLYRLGKEFNILCAAEPQQARSDLGSHGHRPTVGEQESVETSSPPAA